MILQIGRKRGIRPAGFTPLEITETLSGKAKSLTGFTFIELVIVAAIILVLIAVSTPLFKGTYRDLELKDAVYSISKIIQYAQQRAIIEEKKYKLALDSDKMAYRLLAWQEADEEDGASAAGWQETTDRFKGYFYLPEGVKFKGENDKIIFLPNGRCDRVSFYITNQHNRAFEIKTNGRVGHVTVSESKNK